MRRVVVTGVGVISAAGTGTSSFEEALERGDPLGVEQVISLPRGRSRPVRLAGVNAFDLQEFLSPRMGRRMAEEAQMGSSAFLLACREARTDERPVEPERLGTYLGSGFGCMRTTEEYLKGLLGEGLATASPFLFTESLANSPLGHAAIILDARGPSIGIAGGDGSAVPAVAEGWRAIRKGRIDRAICGGLELASPTMTQLLVRLSVRGGRQAFLGEGATALVLESEETARAGGAHVLAEVLGAGQAGDPAARPTGWSQDPAAWASAQESALACAEEPGAPLRVVFRHDPPGSGAADAERLSLERLSAERGSLQVRSVHRTFGSYAAAGGLSVAAGAIACLRKPGRVLVSAGSWGGATSALLMASSEA
jgi:3-oxoacyl-[acyl-carrier-protein] synthase II